MIERLIVGALATWRITSLLIREDGPWDVLVSFRGWFGRTDFGTGLLSCPWCLSVWVGAVVGLLTLTDAWIVNILFAFSAVAIVMEKWLGLNV